MTKLTEASLYKGDKLEGKMQAWAKRAAGAQAEAHKIACSVLLHFGQHKDTRVIQQFIMLVPDSYRTNGLRKWFEKFAAVKFIVEGEGEGAVERLIYVKDKLAPATTGAALVGEGIKVPFWKFKAMEGAPYQPVDEAALVKSIIDKLRKDVAKTGKDHAALLYALENYQSIPHTLPTPAADDPLAQPTPAVIDPLAQPAVIDPVL